MLQCTLVCLLTLLPKYFKNSVPEILILNLQHKKTSKDPESFVLLFTYNVLHWQFSWYSYNDKLLNSIFFSNDSVEHHWSQSSTSTSVKISSASLKLYGRWIFSKGHDNCFHFSLLSGSKQYTTRKNTRSILKTRQTSPIFLSIIPIFIKKTKKKKQVTHYMLFVI